MFPETYGRTLEELAFLFEDQSLAQEAAAKVEKQIQQELMDWGSGVDGKGVTTHISAAHTAHASDGDERFARWVAAEPESGSWDGTASGGLVWHDENELRQGTKKKAVPGVDDRFSRWP